MKKFLLIVRVLVFMLLLFQKTVANADALPITIQDYDNILAPQEKRIEANLKEDSIAPMYYMQKNEEIKLAAPQTVDNSVTKTEIKIEPKIEVKYQPQTKQIDIKVDKENPAVNIEIITKKVKEIVVGDDEEKILSEATRKINAIYPLDVVSPTNTYPGYRGPNQLIIYNKDFGKTTGTNEFGKEAVVVDDIVVALTGANSNIPRDGYVISGHGSAKKWISDNLKIGTKISIKDRTIRAYTTIDSYRYFAKAKINEVEDVLISTKTDYDHRDDKYVYYYLKKAKQLYRKSKKDSSEICLNYAKESIRNASLAFRYTLPYLENELKGTWIRPTEVTTQEIQQTLDKIKDTGINNVFLETYYHGKTIFPSVIMEGYGFEQQNPDFRGFDPLAVWIREAHKRGMKIHVWFESFYIGNKPPETNVKSILAVKPEWMNRTKQKANYEGYVSHSQEHNGYFLDPANPEVTKFLLQLIEEISARYNIDGFNIDYVRYPNIAKENLNNQWGYTRYAREEFFLIYGIDPLEIKPREEYWNAWCEYRRAKITEYVKKASDLLQNRNIIFSAVIFPDYKVSLQTKFQDWGNWATNGYLNALTPLILTGDEELAKSMLEEIKKKTTNHAYIYPGLFAGFIESDPEDLLRQIHIARKLKLNGVILFDWAHLSDEYRDVLKTSAFKEKTY